MQGPHANAALGESANWKGQASLLFLRHLLALLGETLRVRSRRLRVQIRRGLTARQSTNIRFYNYVHERRGRKVFAPREQREHVTWREYTPPTVNAESVIAAQRRVALIARKQMCAMYVCLFFAHESCRVNSTINISGHPRSGARRLPFAFFLLFFIIIITTREGVPHLSRALPAPPPSPQIVSSGGNIGVITVTSPASFRTSRGKIRPAR